MYGYDLLGVEQHIVRQNAFCRVFHQGFISKCFVIVVIGYDPFVHRRNRNGYNRQVALQSAIAGFVGEAVCAVEVCCRRVDEGTIRVQGQRAVGDIINQNRCETVSIHICVVFQYAWGVDGQFSTFFHHVCIVNCHGGIVDRAHDNADGGDIAVGDAVICLEGEAVCAVVIQAGCVSRHVADQAHSSVSRLGNDGVSQRLPVNIGCHQGNGDRGVFGGAHRLVLGDRRSVDKCPNCDRNSGGVAIELAIVRLVGEGVHTAEASVGNVSEGTIRVERQRTVAGIRDLHCGQCIVVGISVVAQNTWGWNGQCGAKWRCVSVIHSNRSKIPFSHGYGDGLTVD